MSVNLIVREQLPDNAIILDNASYDESIIGITLEGAIIYSYDRMVEEYMIDNECTYDEAVDWIDYNTVRALPYLPQPRPIIVYEI